MEPGSTGPAEPRFRQQRIRRLSRLSTAQLSSAQLSSSSCLPVDHKASHACTKTDGGYESLTNNIESAGKRVVVNIVCDYDEKCSLFLFLSLSLFQFVWIVSHVASAVSSSQRFPLAGLSLTAIASPILREYPVIESGLSLSPRTLAGFTTSQHCRSRLMNALFVDRLSDSSSLVNTQSRLWKEVPSLASGKY
jgi:hypothetical protein